jgi:hypothetical protein
VIGIPIAPLIKVTGNTRTFERLREDMDFNAGRVLTGELSMANAARALAGLIAGTAAGQEPPRSARPPRILPDVQTPVHAFLGSRLSRLNRAF